MTGFRFKGRVKCDVIDHHGRTVLEGRWQRNLILTRGLNRIGEDLICNMFLYAAKGTGTAETSDVGVTDTYILSGGNTLTRTAAGGTNRIFTAADVGKVFRYTDNGVEALITGYTSATIVTVTAVGGGAATNHAAGTVGTIYNTDQDWLSITEEGVTAIDPAVTTVSFDGTDTVTNDTPGSFNFQVGDVGKFIYFNAAKVKFKITARVSDDEVTVENTDGADALSGDTAALYTPISDEEGSKSRAVEYATGECGTITSGAERTFTRVFLFPENTANVTYEEIMLSDEAYPGDNINVRINLASGVAVLGPAGANPGQRLKVTYELTTALSYYVGSTQHDADDVEGSFSSTSEITGTSFSGQAKSAIEAYATSTVATDGTTDDSFTMLEPSVPGYIGLSTVATALAALGSTQRDAGENFKEMELAAYAADTFVRDRTGTFELNDANGAWKCLMIYDPDSTISAYTRFYSALQTKDVDHQLSVTFRSSWGRDLS